jgi:hypothetical protein
LSDLLLSGLNLLATLVWVGVGLGLLRFRVGLPRLPEVTANPPEGGWPRLSVVIAARDEGPQLAASVGSLLDQDYPDLEIVVVNDRSTDGSRELLESLAREDLRVVPVHVEELPSGWLGKNHANHQGAGRATGEWLLFTDGDVLFAPSALRRAVAFATERRLGHFVAFPHLIAPGLLERAFVSGFAVAFNLKTRLWRLSRPATSSFVGVGAFNLVRRDAYERIGGHTRLAMEVVDDVKLGMILRRSGVPQGGLDSGGLVRVRWQHGLLASLGGLVKNAFAAVEWRWSAVLAVAVLLGAAAVVPAASLVLIAPPSLKLTAVLPVAMAVVTHGLVARDIAGGRVVEGVLFPVAASALIGVLIWSAVAATFRDGIVWRGTRYGLAELRAGCVREGDWPTHRAVGWASGPADTVSPAQADARPGPDR